VLVELVAGPNLVAFQAGDLALHSQPTSILTTSQVLTRAWYKKAIGIGGHPDVV